MVTTELNEGEASSYNIRNTESFLKKLSSWVNDHIMNVEEPSGKPVEYEVVLSTDEGEQSIFWEARANGFNEFRSGVLYDDLKVLRHAGLRKAVLEVRETFKLDVVTQLGIVVNLDGVMMKQIPSTIRHVREKRKSSQ